MLILDFSQLFYGAVTPTGTDSFKKKLKALPVQREIGPDLWRLQTLEAVRRVVKQFKREYGNPIIAADSTTFWRREYFPYYKHKRKTQRAALDIDWKAAFALLNQLVIDLHESFGYPVVRVDGAEADDVIAVLTKRFAPTEPVMIQSRDGDFAQLHTLQSVKQFDHVSNRIYRDPDPQNTLIEHVLTGDSLDGVPNVLSDDDALANPDKRQKQLRSRQLESLKNEWQTSGSLSDENLLRNLIRNSRLIDFKFIPDSITDQINQAYDSSLLTSRRNVMEYCVKHKLKSLLPYIGDF